MVIKSINSKKQKTKGLKNNLYFIVLAVATLLFTIYFSYKAYITDSIFSSISLIAFLTGLLLENFRVSHSKRELFFFFCKYYLGLHLVVLFFIFILFASGEPYLFDFHLGFWLILFLFFFIYFSAVFNKENTNSKLSEGFTFLLSISAVYWIIESDFNFNSNWFFRTLLIVVLLFSSFSTLHAFTSITLSKFTKISLGIWGRLVLLAFTIENIVNIYNTLYIGASDSSSDEIYIALQFFFLGISTVYISQNFMLLFAYIPTRFEDILPDNYSAFNTKDLINSFLDTQIGIRVSFFCIIYSGIIFSVNYFCSVLPTNTAIWFVLFSFPILIQIYDYLEKKFNLN